MSKLNPSAQSVKNEKKKLSFKNFKQLALNVKKYWLMFIIAAILITIGVICQILEPQYLSDLSNELAESLKGSSINIGIVGKYALICLFLLIGYGVCTFLADVTLITMAYRYSQDLREKMQKKINKIPLSYFDSHITGDTLSIVTNDVEQLGYSLQQSFGNLIHSLFLIVGVVIAMFATCWQMALGTISTIPVIIILMGIILKVASPHFTKRQELVGEVNGLVEENFSGQMIIKLFNAEEKKAEEFNEKNTKLGKAMFKAEFFGGLMMPIMNFMSYFAYALVCLIGGLLLANGQGGIEYGTITAFLVYVNLFQSPLSQIAQSLNLLQSAIASSGRIYTFLAIDEMEEDSQKERKIYVDGDYSKIKGKIEFKHLSFSYDPSREIIHDFSAVVQPGMKVAIVGPTGAGKTTIVNLLMKFYDPDKGTILIDDVPISEMSRAEVHDIFSMVLQDTWVFEGTLKDNLIYNTEGVTDEDIDAAIHDAHLVHFVRALPGGVNYMMSDSSEISGGQKQLITIARAMIEKAPLLILDEATSNVDTRTEEKIQEAMDRLTKGKTSFVIAHRLSTIKNADLILVMRDGNIVETGTHESLMELNGFYASLYNSQFSLE